MYMAKPDNNLGDILRTPQASKLLGDPQALQGLLQSPDTQKLVAMLNQQAGAGLKSAADAAAKGDPGALVGLINQLMNSREGAGLIERINKKVSKQ